MSVTDQELVIELRELADHPRLAARGDQLRGLADAIADPGEAGRWCELDLFAAFSPDDTVLADGEPAETGSARGVPKRRRRLGSAVGPALTFVPIFITWLGLMMATGAYGDLLDAGGLEAARRPFLEMWQQGFDGRLPAFFTFDNIALCTLTAIFCLILWTVFENITRNGREETEERELAALRIRLRRALTQASLVLGVVRLSSPVRFGAEIGKVAADIGSVGTMARKVHTELVEALTLSLEATRKTTDALAASAIDVGDAVELLGKHLATINSTCDDLTTAVTRASAVIDSAGSRTDQAVTSAGNQLSNTISRTTLDMRRAFNDELVRSMRSVQGTVSGLDTRIDKLVDATMSIGHAVDRTAASIGAVGSSTEKAVDLLGDRVSGTLLGAAEELRRSFGDTGAEIRKALDDWAAAAEAHTARTTCTARAAPGSGASEDTPEDGALESGTPESGRVEEQGTGNRGMGENGAGDDGAEGDGRAPRNDGRATRDSGRATRQNRRGPRDDAGSGEDDSPRGDGGAGTARRSSR
ncbi:hypothetical protein GCM10017673_21220 [Streptosporangium violaceochromogenes]|nr:hypothetical protein GCM10017673_21220 [Streptosporangium violaceochromogenes]